MVKDTLVLAILISMFAGCACQSQGQSSEDSEEKPVEDRAVRTQSGDKQSGLRLTLVEITPMFDGKTYHGRFTFKNRSNKPVHVLGCPSAVKGIVRAVYVEGDIFEGGNWKPVEVHRDMLPLTFPVPPGESVELLADLPFREESGSPLTVRIRVGELVSNAFVLDWEADRKEQKFALARTRHIQHLRRLLRKAGFKDELLRHEDFWRKFVEAIQDRVSNGDGFEPFRSNTVPLPEIDVGDVIIYNLWADDVTDYENRYHLEILLAPSRLPLNWLQHPELTKVQTHIRGKRGEIILGDSPGEQDKERFRFRLEYFVASDGKPPSEKYARELGANLLAELREQSVLGSGREE